MRQFLTGAVTQHYTKSLARTVGTDFRLPTSQELDLTLAFQQALGRTNELDLTQVNLFDADANAGRLAFMDPQRGRCNVCHFNAGANSQDTGKNRNFDTFTRLTATASFTPTFDGSRCSTAASAARTSQHPNFDADDNRRVRFLRQRDVQHAIADRGRRHRARSSTTTSSTSSTPAATSRTRSSSRRRAVHRLARRPGAAARFGGTPITLAADDGFTIGRFLRALNVAFNLDIAKQRLRAAQTLFNRFRDTRNDLQIELMQLAVNEIDDALDVLATGKAVQPFYPVAVDRIDLAKAEIAAAIAAPASSRGGRSRTRSRGSRTRATRSAPTSTSRSGPGNLFF